MVVFIAKGKVDSDKLIRFAYVNFVALSGHKKQEDIKIIREEGKKPRLNCEDIFFSLSHSEDVTAIAISDRNVGLDIEWGRERNYNKIKFIKADCLDTFYREWTKHEAYYKYLGTGIKKEAVDNSLTYETFILYENCYLTVCSEEEQITGYEISLEAVESI